MRFDNCDRQFPDLLQRQFSPSKSAIKGLPCDDGNKNRSLGLPRHDISGRNEQS
jgi:hypothetical protein